MPQFTIPASFLIEANTREEAAGLAQSAIDYSLEVSNDDGAIAAAGADTPDALAPLEALRKVINRAVPAGQDSTGQDMVKVRRALLDELRALLA